MSKQKNPNTIENETTVNALRGKKSNRPTACIDARRMWGHCGICGSENIALEGVKYCSKCKKEKHYLISDKGWFQKHEPIKGPCNCKRDHILKHGKFYGRSGGNYVWVERFWEYYEIKGCGDCGAVKGALCPNCRKPLWLSTKGVRRCKNCGFQHPGYIKS